ncbi:MAG: hypothetical protein HOP02_13610 [Methylococcaceae bacterium]|nr:hypothetical protein [Methylococcaceae bacterium]
MENKELVNINERLDNIDARISLIFCELQRRNPDDTCSFAMYASTYFTAQQIREVHSLFGQATCDQIKNKFDITEFREQFEEFRQRHLPQSDFYSLRVIAEGFIVEGRMVSLCEQLLDDIKKHPEKNFPIIY